MRDFFNAPRRRAQRERLADLGLEDHLLIQFADTGRLIGTGQEDPVQPAIGNRSRVGNRDALRAGATGQATLQPIPRDAGTQLGELVGRVASREHVEDALERAAAHLAFAPYADLLWWETSEPDLEEAERFANAIHREFPGKMLAYNCSPSFNWRKKLSPERIANFQRDIGSMGYSFQFVTLAGFHSLNLSMFDLARGYRERGMAAYSELQQAEFAAEATGYTATRHQREVGVGYFDAVAAAVSGGQSSTTAFSGSTEAAQFHDHPPTPNMHRGDDDGLVHNHEWEVTAK